MTTRRTQTAFSFALLCATSVLVGCGSNTNDTAAPATLETAAETTAAAVPETTVAPTTAPPTTAAPTTAAPTIPPTTAAPTTAAPTVPPPQPVMPNVLCMNLQDAQDYIQTFGVFLSFSEDATGAGRNQVIDSNWQVVAQYPDPGTPFGEGDATLYVVKYGEQPNPC